VKASAKEKNFKFIVLLVIGVYENAILGTKVNNFHQTCKLIIEKKLNGG
jgi:hypothetical protein